MKKNLLLMLATVFIGSSIHSQNTAKIKTHKALPYSAYLDRPSNGTAIPYSVPFVPYRGAAGLKGIILGSSGNLYTIISSESNMVAASNDLNTIIFIHRNDPISSSYGGDVAMYNYDISKDGGITWKRDIGPLNPSANGTEIKPSGRDTLHARYPQVAIYNPKNNSDPDSAYLVYFGPYHTGGGGNDTWQGTNSGVSKLDGDTSTFTESFIHRNNGDVLIPKSLIKSSEKVYWSVDFEYDGSTVSDILVYRGIWSDVAKDVIWTLNNKLDPDHYFDNQGVANATGLHIDFAPSGKIGWIGFVGDLSQTGVYNPIFYKTVDGGNTWLGPEEVLLTPDVDSLTGTDSTKHKFLTSTSLAGKVKSGDKITVVSSSLWDGMYTVDSVNSTSVTVIETIADTISGDVFGDLLYGPMLSIYNSLDTLSTGIPTSTYETDFAVDINGTPHYCTVIGGGDSYSIQSALSLNIWDIYYNAEEDRWDAMWLDTINEFRGTLSGDVTSDNRVQLSKTQDGTIIFFGWCDTDDTTAGDNSQPNFNLKAWDIVNKKLTPATNFTKGDPTYDSGATFASIGTTVLQDTTGKYIIPVVIANPIFGDPLKSTEFHYIQGIEFSDSDFTIDNAPPVITLTGNQYVTIVKGSDYTDAGATAWDNVDGDISDSILTKNLVDTSALGTYLVTYDVTDNSGFDAEQVTRYVTIVAVTDTIPPVIALTGFDTVSVEIGDAYLDSGATATDNVNGDITDQIVTWDNIDYDTVGTFWVKYTVADGAGNQSDTITRIVVLTDYTVPSITLVGDDNPYYHGKNRPWIDPGALATDNLDGDISDKVVIAGTVDVTILGTYSLTYNVTDANGNAATQVTRKVEVVWPAGIEQQMLNQAISIYPNPSSGYFFLDLTLPEVKNCKISLFNILGEKVSMIETGNHIQKQFLVNVSAQPNGVYFVKIETEKGQVTKKMVINK